MRKLIILLAVIGFLPCVLVAQISHGGTPLFLLPEEKSGLRNAISSDKSFFVEMPPFNVDSMLADDHLNESNMRGSIRFANKFFTSIERGKTGHNFTLADGTRVWQAGIRSAGAYSINVLFSEFHIPEGGKLFLYAADKSHIIGSFTHENNSEDRLLPTAPVKADEIIVEYSEPADAAFEGVLKITEVNHDYRGILRSEPSNNNTSYYNCMPDILCSEGKDSDIKNSTVLLIINGSTLCSGSLINNTSNDGTPYLLTGMHCFNLNNPIHYPMQHYVDRAGTIVTFFNYNRPVCGTKMRGVEEMSVAGAKARCIIEPLDIALLELNDTPPDHYRAYYAGWNINTTGGSKPYTNIHHPMGDLKKYGKSNKSIAIASLTSYPLFALKSFWEVPGWTTGSTDFGSSGSPLFDSENLLIGALTGGSSTCNGDGTPDGAYDYFSALYLGWQYQGDSLQLKKWLDRDNTGLKKIPGLDPNAQAPFTRMANADYNNGDQLVLTKKSTGSDYLFGSDSQSVMEYAEAFENNRITSVYGTYVLNPLMTYPSGIQVNLYSSVNGKPGETIATTSFHPQYTNYSNNSFPEVDKKTSGQASESFIRFPGNPQITGNFFIGYQIPSNNSFLVYNTLFGGTKPNTAWIKDPQNGWIAASAYTGQPVTTALALQPLLKISDQSAITTPELSSLLKYDRSSHSVIVDCQPEKNGTIAVYSVTGQCLQQSSFNGPAAIPVNPSLVNTVGIIRLSVSDETVSLKVVF